MTDQNCKHFESRGETAEKNASQNFTVSGNVQKTHAHFTQEIKRIYSSLAAKDAENDGKFDKRDGVVEHLTNHFEEKIGNTDQIRRPRSRRWKRDYRLQQHFTDVITTMDGKPTDKDEAQDAAHSQLYVLVNTNHLSLVENCETLEKRVNESTAQFQQDCNTTGATLENLITAGEPDHRRVEGQRRPAERGRGTYARQHLELMVFELSRSVTAQYDTLDARFNEEFTRVKDYCNAIEHRHTQVINEEHEQFHSRCHLLEKECTDINVALTRRHARPTMTPS